MSRKQKGKKNIRAMGENYSEISFADKNTAELYRCSLCGKPIKDISSALSNKEDGNPVHFDCVLERLKKIEPLNTDEHIVYIGKGQFAVIKYDSPVTMKEFSIVRVIEWEDKKERSPWRSKISDIFSQID